jgi:transcriptional regulator with GAF, ATPase, and Fis domain
MWGTLPIHKLTILLSQANRSLTLRKLAHCLYCIPNMTDLTSWRREFAPEIVGESEAIHSALETIQQIANTTCSVLITGETGSGKELFARAVHRASGRRNKAFIPVNCAAIPDTLLESELFGHIKGAFTGATTARPGRFMAAHEGTIFLDEIGDLPLAAQAKLLRVLEERTVCPVGSDVEMPVDVRVVAATHRNLEEMIAEGTFRADLYFRLSMVPLHLPPLRERAEDMLAIADVCLARANERLGRTLTLDVSARSALAAYHWPGNVRELSHLIERAALLARKPTLSSSDIQIPGSAQKFARGTVPFAKVEKPVVAEPVMSVLESEHCSLDLRAALENLEKVFIERALSKAKGNRTEAAALLGLNRTTLVEKLRKYAA